MLEKKIKNLARLIIDLIFPIYCLGCGAPGEWLCQSCQNNIKIKNKFFCVYCCQPAKKNFICTQCRKTKYLDGLLFATNYDNELIRSLIKLYKYNNIREIRIVLAKIIMNFLSQLKQVGLPDIIQESNNSIITCVPLHKKRLIRRGYNQAAELGRIISKFLKKPFYKNLLMRKRYTWPQAKLNKKQRLQNVKNAFAINKKFELRGKNVIIIDDVSTTTSTLNECAKAIKQNFPHCQVWGLIIAHGK